MYYTYIFIKFIYTKTYNVSTVNKSSLKCIVRQTLEPKGSLHADHGGAKSCSFSGSSELIAVACDNEIVYVWDVDTLQLVA